MSRKKYAMRSLLRWSISAAFISTLGMAGAAFAGSPSVSGILTGSWQHANGSKSSQTSRWGSGNAQLDMLLGLPMGPGSWQMEFKIGTTPRSNGVSAVFPEATGLVGEALDGNGKGRAAITQLYYQATPAFGTVSAGLLFDPSFIDTNPIADDEYRQFMSTVFVNNPTIPMPVYAMGGVVQGPMSKDLGYTVLVQSTADLHQSTYGNALDFNGKGHGTFDTAELNWKASGLSGNVGLWRNDDKSFANFATGNPQADYGAYTNFSGKLGSRALRWNVRAGWANPKVSQASGFAGAALSYASTLPLDESTRPVTYGLGVAHTWVSSDVIGPKANRDQGEAYAKVGFPHRVSVTLDLQYLRHSQFDPSDTGTWVEGVRAAVEF